MSLRIIKRNPAGQDKEVLLEIDPVGSSSGVQTYSVKGIVSNQSDEPQAGKQVVAYDKGLADDDFTQIGNVATTSAEGEYLIYYTTAELNGKLFADLQLKVFAAGANVSSDPSEAESALYVNALPNEEIDINISAEDFIGPTEYSQLAQELASYLPATFDVTTFSLQSINILAAKIEKPPVVVGDYLKAKDFHDTYYGSIPAITEEIIYGLLRFDLPYDYEDFIEVSESDKTEALLAATESNIIDPSIAGDITSILNAFREALYDDGLLDDEEQGPSFAAQLLTIAGITNQTKQRDFYQYFVENDGQDDLWAKLVTDNKLTQPESDAAKLVFSYSLVTQSHLPLIENLWDDVAINSVEDLGDLSEADWMAKISIPTVGVPNVDLPYENAEDVEYAKALVSTVERLYPSKVLDKEIDADGGTDFTTTKALINSAELYDIKDDSPRRIFQRLGGPYTDIEKEEVFRNKRLYHVFDRNNRVSRIKNFKNNKLSSSVGITRRGRRRFIKEQEGFLGSKGEARKVYNKAYKRKAAALMMHAKYNPGMNGVNTRVNRASPIPYRYDDLPNATDEEKEIKAQLEVFFGSLDYCNCKHCRSSTSPAAYLVDLLEFLKEAENTSNGATETAWKILKARRPDIPKIELTCDNTNTVMPYIDLVNEVLENEVSQAGLVSRQTSLPSDALRVMPEHLDVAAYNILANEVYPWILPFNLWNEEASAYLKALNLDRSSITRAFKGQGGLIGDITIEEACAQLGISAKMLNDVLLSSAFMPFYGGASSGTLQSVRELLNRTGLEYQELLELLDSSFLNPTGENLDFDPVTSCDIDDATLSFGNNDFYINLHKFYRLKGFLGWSTSELDVALSALGAGNITSTVIRQLAGLDKLSKRFRIDVEVVASWYGLISTTSYGDNKSYFEKVFLNPAYNSDAAVRFSYSNVIAVASPAPIELVSAVGDLNQPNASVVMAALRISSQDLIALIDAEITDGSSMDLSDLSHIYRVATFIRALKISVKDYLTYKSIFGLVPISETSNSQDPDDTLGFLVWFDLIKNLKIKLGDLNFLFNNDTTTYPLAATDKLGLAAGLIRSKLLEKLSEIGVSASRSEEDLLNLFLAFFGEEDAVTSFEIIKEQPTGQPAIDNATAFIDSMWEPLTTDFSDAIALIKDKLITGGAGTLITDATERRNYAFQVFYPELSKRLSFENEVAQLLADEYDIPVANVLKFLNKLKNPGNASQSVAELLSEHDFVFGSATIDLTNNPNHLNSLFATLKALLVQEKLRFKEDQVDFLLDSTATTGWFNISLFPDLSGNNTAWDFATFISMCQAFNLENRYRTNSFSLISLISEAVNASPTDIRTTLSQKLSDGTGWTTRDIDWLLSLPEVISGQPDFLNEGWLVKLDSIFSIVEKVNVSAEQLGSWKSFDGTGLVDISYEQAQAIRASVRSNYSEVSWNKIAVEIRDKLRMKQRDALVTYIIANDASFKSTDDLYSYFLIDTETAPCSLTSRIKLATSTVQLWVQRIRMDLENGILFNDQDLDEWEWRKNYRVWEAARKVFLYPENWIEPELRDDKSFFFKELEDELLQDDINSETAERVYLNYLKKMDEIANLEIAATFQEKDQNLLHVFARTKNSPSTYFYRKLENEITWTDWERVELDIEGDHLIPVVFNRRPMLFWPVFTEMPEKEKASDLTYDPKSSAKIVGKNASTVVQIQLAYSEWNNNKWQPQKLSNSRIISDFGFSPEYYFFKTEEKSEGLFIDAYYQDRDDQNANHVGEFFLNNCTGEIIVTDEVNTSLPNSFLISNSYRDYMKIKSEGSQVFEITERLKPLKIPILTVGKNLRINKTQLLGKIPSQFKITYPVTESEILSESPFFYEDGNRIFFVKPSEETYSKKLVTQLPPELFIKEVKKYRKVPVPVKPKPKPPIRHIRRIYPPPVREFGEPNRFEEQIGFREMRRLDLGRFF